MKRLDLALVDLALAPSRTKAQQMIEAGEVEIFAHGHWRVAEQASASLREPSHETIRVRPNSQTLKYVSRGGLKLESALKHLGLDPRGWKCLDLGISTGGFTDCLLQAGASEVVGIDVGHGQLSAKLASDSRVKHFEGLNARGLADSHVIPRQLDICVVDLSFISLLQIIPVLREVLPPGCRLLALVKPQFEVGREGLDKNGIVRDEKLFDEVKVKILGALEKYGFSVKNYFPCELKGQDGNLEFFVFA